MTLDLHGCAHGLCGWPVCEVGDERALLLFAFRVSGARLWREGGLAWCGEHVWMGGWVVDGLRIMEAFILVYFTLFSFYFRSNAFHLDLATYS